MARGTGVIICESGLRFELSSFDLVHRHVTRLVNAQPRKLIIFYQQMHFYLTYKILNIKVYIKTLFYSHSYMFRPVRTIIRESILSLAKVTFL